MSSPGRTPARQTPFYHPTSILLFMRWRRAAAFILAASVVAQLSPFVFDATAPTPAVAEVLPAFEGGYGYDPATATMYDHNGFAYSYQPDGVMKLVLPWGYTTYFSFGLTGDYLGVPQERTALDYTWTWAVEAVGVTNETGALLGYDYGFTATSSGGAPGWTILFEFFQDPGVHMKVTHEVTNDLAAPLTDCSFWWLFDLALTPAPYTIETAMGTVEGPLYQAIPDSVHWVRLSNEFQFDWRDALDTFENGMAYIGDGSVIGLDGRPILGVSIDLGDIAPGATLTVDPYFSGVTRTWNAAADGYSGIAANWDPVGVPATGDNITFDGTSIKNCTWNTTVTVGAFVINTAFTGNIYNAASWGCASYTSAYPGGGYFYQGSSDYTITCAGNFMSGYDRLMTNGTYGRLTINMTGDGVSFRIPNDSIGTLRVSGSMTTANHGGYWASLHRSLVIETGSSFIVAAGSWTGFSPQISIAGPSFDNQGTIGVLGILGIIPSVSFSADFGVIYGAGSFYISGYSSRSILMVDDAIIEGLMVTSAANVQYTLSGEGYDLSISNLTLKNGGKVVQGGGSWSIRNYTQTTSVYATGTNFTQGGPLTFTTSFLQYGGSFNLNGDDFLVGGNFRTNGTSDFNQATAEVVLYGSSKTLGTDDSQAFYDLAVSGSYTTTSSVNVSHDLAVTGSLTLAASTGFDWNATAGAYSNTGTIDGGGTLYLTLQDDYTLTLGLVQAATVIRKAVGSMGTHTVALAVDTSLEADLTVSLGVVLDPNDKVVTFTGDMDLNLSSGSTLWNCTVSAGVTLNLLADLTVELRATIDGTVTGADLIQPPPTFTSSPDGTATTLEFYTYTVTQAYWDSFAVVDAPSWMYFSDGAMVGTPTDAAVGVHNVSLSLTWEGVTTYQNFTVLVTTPFVTSAMSAYMGLALSLVLGLGCLVVGLVFKMPYMVFFAGLVWVFSAVALYQSINIGWAVLGIGLGVILMYAGGFKVVASEG